MLAKIAVTAKQLSAFACLTLAVTSCTRNEPANPSLFTPPEKLFNLFSPRRLIVIKVVQGYGDFEESDTALITDLCLKKYKGSITQEQFEEKHSGQNIRLVSGPPIEYSVHTEVDERLTVAEYYIDRVSVPSYIDGVAMNDGKTIAIKKQREIVKGRLRNIYAQCTAFEYHF
jgi:hypothetical protein